MSSKRVRLTERRSKQAVDGSIPYPGNVNQPDRQFKKHDQYDNWEEVINHPLPDMRHDWQNDERDEIGFGIPEAWGASPTTASVKVAANKAVKLSYLLLGSKVAETVIEDQANDFMLLGPDAMDRTLARFASTGELYAEDEEEPVVAKEEPVVEKEAEEDDKKDDKKEASEALAEEGAEPTASVEDSGASEVEASEAEKSEPKEAAADVKEAADDKEEDSDDDKEEEDDSKKASHAVNDMDIELTSTMDDGAVEPDSRLAGLFDDEIPAELPEPGAGKREASSKKQGIKSLGGGQPKVASGDNGATDISNLWSDAPDVSDIFR